MTSSNRASISLAVFLALALMQEPASAQEEAPETPTSIDTVYLVGGGLYRGRIVELIPEDHVTIIINGTGETKTVPWKEVRRISADAPVTARPVAPTPSPTHVEEPPRPHVPEQAQWRPNQPLFIGGALAFGLAYGLTLLVATPSVLNGAIRFLDGKSSLRSGGVQLVVPFFGPFLFVGNHPQDEVLNSGGGEVSDSLRDGLYISGVLQIAGGVAMIAGLVMGGRAEPSKKGGTTTPSLRVMPLASQSTLGLSVGAFQW